MTAASKIYIPPPAGDPHQLTMGCWTEASMGTLARRAAWHADCCFPETCPCSAHKDDKARTS